MPSEFIKKLAELKDIVHLKHMNKNRVNRHRTTHKKKADLTILDIANRSKNDLSSIMLESNQTYFSSNVKNVIQETNYI